MNSKELLMRLSSAVGVSGRENSVVNMAAEELKALGEVTVSPLGDLICCVQKPKEGEKCFMLDAHVDEIGMIVTWIDDEGFLKVSSVGGFDRSLLLASQICPALSAPSRPICRPARAKTPRWTRSISISATTKKRRKNGSRWAMSSPL